MRCHYPWQKQQDGGKWELLPCQEQSTRGFWRHKNVLCIPPSALVSISHWEFLTVEFWGEAKTANFDDPSNELLWLFSHDTKSPLRGEHSRLFTCRSSKAEEVFFVHPPNMSDPSSEGGKKIIEEYRKWYAWWGERFISDTSEEQRVECRSISCWLSGLMNLSWRSSPCLEWGYATQKQSPRVSIRMAWALTEH